MMSCHVVEVDTVRSLLAEHLSSAGMEWLEQSVEGIEASPLVIRSRFPAAGRRCGRGPLVARPASGLPAWRSWTVDDAVRAVLLTALPLSGSALIAEIGELYRYGDVPERRGLLRALDVLDASSGLGDAALPFVRHALRGGDATLVAAALAGYAARYLDDVGWRHGVLKSVLLDIPLTEVCVRDRVDEHLVALLRLLAAECAAAGRPVPPQVWLIAPPDVVLSRSPNPLAALEN
jgi:hypothetical protein